jgi:N-acetylmuramoyl-L-alanine amidase
MPSVLSEIAFLSNPQEEKLLKTPEHRQKIAEALYSGIVNYVETLSVVKVAGRQNESVPATK